MENKNLSYENYLMASMGDIEERYKILADLRPEIDSECENNEELKMTVLLDMEKSFDDIEESYTYFRKNLYK